MWNIVIFICSIKMMVF